MQKKEFYRRKLPHFQQPGQAYFITWSLKDAIPTKALSRYSKQLQELKNRLEFAKHTNYDQSLLDKLKTEYYTIRKKYIYAYDQLLDSTKNPKVSLNHANNLKLIHEALHYWEGKKLENIAYSIMPNHIHWVMVLYELDEQKNPVYLQDVLQSVKRYSARKINQLENRSGSLWQKESFDTTIRDDKHLYNAVEYTLNNPVNAGLVKDRSHWAGNFLSPGF